MTHSVRERHTWRRCTAAIALGMVAVEDISMGNRALLIENSTLTIENRALLIGNEAPSIEIGLL